MQVTISVCGRFHAFYLAQQLLKRGYLKRLITSYPKFEVTKYGIPKDKIRSIVIKELMWRGWLKGPLFLKNMYDPQNLILGVYDKWASHLYTKSDICVGFAGCSLNTIRKAKDIGSITILERGSAHMAYQSELLNEEYDMIGLRPQLPHPKVLENELCEYDEVDYISIPSSFVKRSFLEKGISQKKLIHIPYGVNLDDFRPITKEDNKFRIVYSGIMSVQKGVHYLLQAVAELRLPNSELLLVGGMADEMKPFFRKYEGHYKYIGHVPQGELYKYYSQGSVFVMMSIQEGLAMVQPQAMACGLPVICTTNTGGEDIVRDTLDGFIISIRDVEALKGILIHLFENPDICKAMGQSAYNRVRKGFSWDDYGDRMVREYEKILNGE